MNRNQVNGLYGILNERKIKNYKLKVTTIVLMNYTIEKV